MVVATRPKLERPRPKPVTKSRHQSHRVSASHISEVLAVCPHCSNAQPLSLSRGELVATRKYLQIGNRVYHDCGSASPCRLHVNWY